MPTGFGVEFIEAIKKTAVKLLEETKAEGFNVINNNFEAAGQVINHFHVHIIPRKKGTDFNPGV